MMNRTANFMVSVAAVFRKSSSETVSMTGFKSLLIFMPKRSGLSSQDWFLYRNDATVHGAASVQDFKRRLRRKDSPLPAIFARYQPSGLVSVLESEDRAG